MFRRLSGSSQVCISGLLVALAAASVGRAADKSPGPHSGKAAGIYIDRKDNRMIVKVDGDDEPTEFLIDPADKKLAASLKGIFNACRVQLSYKSDGETRRLVSARRHILKETGTITGAVVKVWNDFWVEVKPKVGVADAFAAGANYNDPEFMGRLEALEPGDTVSIDFTTDFERHRIQNMRKIKSAGEKPAMRQLQGEAVALGNSCSDQPPRSAPSAQEKPP